MMSLEWTVVAMFLYIEVGIIALFLIPWIRPKTWNKLFNMKSDMLKFAQSYSHVYFWVCMAIMLLLFIDGIREVHKYSVGNPEAKSGNEALLHTKLFRAQRNLYISGFALFLPLVIRRIMDLIKHQVQLEAATEAAMQQAKSATHAAQGLMAKLDGPDATAQLHQELEKVKTDRDTLIMQALGLQNEYDRMCDDFNKLQHKLKRLQGGGTRHKKSD